MKKINKVLAILCASAVVAGVGAFTGCTTPEDGGAHTHNYQYTSVSDTQHKGECNVEGCEDPTITEDHTWGDNDKCTKCDAVKPAAVTVTNVAVNGKTTAKVGEEVQLTATVTGTGNPAQTVTWTKISGEGAVSADGKVTATAAGEVKVKATSTVDTSKSGEYTVTFAAAEVNLTVAEYVGLDDSGANATAEVDVIYDGEGDITATPQNPEILTASYAEGKLTVTAVKTGKTVVELTDGEKTAELTVEVATAGLTYETLSAEDADGNAYEYVQVSDGAGRTSTDVYIPGYRYSEEANEGEGAYLPVTHIKGANTADEVVFDPNGGGFQASNVVSVYLGDNLKVVGGRAFEKCLSLNTVICGENLNYIMGYAFSESTVVTIDLTDLTSLNKIGKACFRSCPSLTEITIPVNVEGVGDAVCEMCPSLTKIRILSTKMTKIWGMSFLEKKGEVDLELWLPSNIIDIAKDAFGSQWTGKNKSIVVYYSGTEDQYKNITYSDSTYDTSRGNLDPNESHCTVHYNSNFAEMLEAEKGE